MNNKFIIVFLLTLISFKAMPQNFWALPYASQTVYDIEKVLTDSLHDKLLVSGRYFNYIGPKRVRGIASWNGSVWDSLSSGINTHDILNNPNNPFGTLINCIRYNGKLLVGGIFQSIGGKNASYLATWDGARWDSLPFRAFDFQNTNAGVYSFINFQNKLYIGGVFDTIQGQPANGLATYDATGFHPVSLPLNSQAYINTMSIYNGELYIGGVFTSSSNASDRCILKYNGTNWTSVGGGIKGNQCYIMSMIPLNNELYVGGYFYQVDGNADNVVMKWDGSSWHSAGWGANTDNGSVQKMLLYHDNIYAFGRFGQAGNNPASNVAVFNGQKWCTFPDVFDNNLIMSAAIYHDTIYISGGFHTINGDTNLKNVAKFVHPFSANDCGALAIKQNEIKENDFEIFPNPANDKLQIQFNNSSYEDRTVCIRNSLGQIVYTNSYTNVIDVSPFLPGVYFIEIKGHSGGSVNQRFIKD